MELLSDIVGTRRVKFAAKRLPEAVSSTGCPSQGRPGEQHSVRTLKQ